MSFDKFESRVVAHPSTQQEQDQRAAERAREPFATAWNREVYPAWQGPLNKAKRYTAVTRVGCAPVGGLAGMVDNLDELLAKLGRTDWVLVENVFVETNIGVGSSVLYAFAGTPRSGALARVPMTNDGGRRVADLANTETWTGALDKLCEVGEADVDEGVELLGAALVAALDAKETREAEEDEARKKAEEEAARALMAATAKAAADAAKAADDARAAHEKTLAEQAEAQKKAEELGVADD